MRKSVQLSAALAAVLLVLPAWNSTTIVGGQPIQIETTPWQLWAGNCGASWIGKNWVVTANHCIEGSVSNPSRVGYCGGITNRSECTAANKILAKKIYQAPGQNGLNQDVALVELTADITAVKAKPIRVITKAQVAAGLEKPGVAAYMSGWGGTSASNGSLPQQLQGLDTKIGNSTRATFISVNKPGAGLCPGDSGGPLCVKDENGQWVLVGAASYITGPCGDNTEDFFGRVSAHLDWIYATTGISPVSTSPDNGVNLGNRIAFENRTLMFQVTRPGDAAITIHSLDGELLWKMNRNFQSGRHALAFDSRPGIYLVKLNENGLQRTQRVIAGQ